MGASLSDYWFLHAFIKAKAPRCVLELGPGSTTSVMAHAFSELEQEGKQLAKPNIYSVEHIKEYYEDLGKYLPDDLKVFVSAHHIKEHEPEIYPGLIVSSYERLPVASCDLIFVDGPPANGLSNGDMFQIIKTSDRPL